MNTVTKTILIDVQYHVTRSGAEYFTVTIQGRRSDKILDDGYILPQNLGFKPRRWDINDELIYVAPEGNHNAGNPFACELSLKSWIESTVYPEIVTFRDRMPFWMGSEIMVPRFVRAQSKTAKLVASRGPPLDDDADVDLIRRNFVDNARLVLLGDFTTLNNMCNSLRAVLANDGAEFNGGLMTRASAKRSNAEGAADFFQFVAAVPVSALSALVERGEREPMHAALATSGVIVGGNAITVHGAAFPGPAPKKCEVGWLRGGDAALSDIATLENGGDVHVLVCGYDDSTHPDERLRKPVFNLNLPGGKRWLGESGLDCALREVLEETRLALRPVGWTYPATELVHHVVEGVRFNYAFGPYHVVASLPDEDGDFPKFAVRPANAPGHNFGKGKGGRGRGFGKGRGGFGKGRGGFGKGRGGSGKWRRNSPPPRSEHGGVATCRYFLQGTCRNGSSCQFRHTGA